MPSSIDASEWALQELSASPLAAYAKAYHPSRHLCLASVSAAAQTPDHRIYSLLFGKHHYHMDETTCKKHRGTSRQLHSEHSEGSRISTQNTHGQNSDRFFVMTSDVQWQIQVSDLLAE